MTVTTKSKADLVAGQTAAVQAQAAGYVDFSEGSILLAFAEAVSDVALWLQGLVLYLLALTRAATSTGADLDSWYADFGNGFARLAAVAATDNLTFSRLSTSGSTYVPVGATVATPDGTQTFAVTTDTTNPAYNANAGGTGVAGYVMAAGTGSVTVPSKAQTPGAASNVVANSLTVITSSIVGVDTVTNALAATGGADAETDVAFRARWPGYLSTLSKGTLAAITAAANSVQVGLFVKVLANTAANYSYQLGNFVVLVDDGTGNPPASLLTNVATAVDAVRALTETFAVQGPSIVTANVVMTVTISPGYALATAQSAVQTAITKYIDATSFGATLAYTKLSQLAYDASPGVENVSAVTLNGAAADLVATGNQLVRAGTVTITAVQGS